MSFVSIVNPDQRTEADKALDAAIMRARTVANALFGRKDNGEKFSLGEPELVVVEGIKDEQKT